MMLTQIDATVPITQVPAQLVLGGLQPAGYVYVGTNQGLAIWVSPEIVAASIMDDGESGNLLGCVVVVGYAACKDCTHQLIFHSGLPAGGTGLYQRAT
jgi:hypothetical protein